MLSSAPIKVACFAMPWTITYHLSFNFLGGYSLWSTLAISIFKSFSVFFLILLNFWLLPLALVSTVTDLLTVGSFITQSNSSLGLSPRLTLYVGETFYKQLQSILFLCITLLHTNHLSYAAVVVLLLFLSIMVILWWNNTFCVFLCIYLYLSVLYPLLHGLDHPWDSTHLCSRFYKF